MLDILSGYGPTGLSAKALCHAGLVMGIGESNTRVALNRLTAQSKITSPKRGYYAINSSGYALHEDVENWWLRDSLIVEWKGDWVAVFEPAPKKPSLSQRRRHRLALELRGFRQFYPGMYLRPNNLKTDTRQLRKDLLARGMHDTSSLFLVNDLSRPDEAKARSLWIADRIHDTYDLHIAALEKSWDVLRSSDVEKAARESILVGRDSIKFVLLDPLLPEELMAGDKRRTLIKSLREYQVKAREIWAGLIAEASASQRQAQRPIVNDIFLFQNI